MNETNEELENWFDKGNSTNEVVTFVKNENAVQSAGDCDAAKMPKSEAVVVSEQKEMDDTSRSETPSDAQNSGEKEYSRADFEAWAADVQAECEKQVEFYKGQVQKAKEDLAAEKEKYTKSCAWHHRKDAIEKRADSLVGDGGYAKICELKAAYVTAQLEADAKVDLEKKLKSAETEYQNLNLDYKRVFAENTDLQREKSVFTQENISLKTSVGELDASLKKCQGDLASWKTIGVRMKGAIVPQCFSGKEWFDKLLEGLEADISMEPPKDAAILLIASISEFAVMERSAENACLDRKKLLSDIGSVVANYMHEKKVAEDEVVKMLRNFEKALRESKIVKDLKISLKVPEIGSDFNVDEVTHRKKGSSVDRIHNWCVISPVGVEMKAIVE